MFSLRFLLIGTSQQFSASSLTNLSRNFDAGECKLTFDDQNNVTKDNNDNKKYKKAVMLDERKAAYRIEVKMQVNSLLL